MKKVATSIAAGALALGLSLPASAHQQGLVNVTIVDAVDVEGNQIVVQVPVAIAANVCGVQVAVLAQDVSSGDAQCEATSTSVANVRGRWGNIIDQALAGAV